MWTQNITNHANTYDLCCTCVPELALSSFPLINKSGVRTRHHFCISLKKEDTDFAKVGQLFKSKR